ncbi:MAG: tetratricopeptide repeat protein, partial [Planctomycetota bacterium]|nr:tetratricopeptide repeat protein [Planctomycetota bacterium]
MSRLIIPALTAVLILAPACGSAPPVREDPPARVKWSEKGVKTYRAGNYEEANRFFLRALEESRDHDDLPSEAGSLANLARVQERLGNLDEARRGFRASMEI